MKVGDDPWSEPVVGPKTNLGEHIVQLAERLAAYRGIV
jgi:hypothetical protein